MGVFDALAHPTRQRILELLRDRDMTAGELADHFDVSKPTLSGHFTKLREAGLIIAIRDGTSIIYSLNLSVVEDALLGLLARLGSKGTPEPDHVGKESRDA